jgi:hypothetical protein
VGNCQRTTLTEPIALVASQDCLSYTGLREKITIRERAMLESMEQDGDWEITQEGLYRAKRAFLIRRGFCCGNRCSNCPYVNWRLDPHWQPVPIEQICRTSVSQRSMRGARALLSYHQEQATCGPQEECGYHQEMIQHYQQMLECWDTNF